MSSPCNFDMPSDDWYDQDAIYKQEPDTLCPGVPSKATLEKGPGNDGDGAVRSKFKGNGHDHLLYSNESSTHYVTVERLVWVDGWRQTTLNETSKVQQGDMTLVVLKLVFGTNDPSSKFSSAIVDLRFHSDMKKGQDPEVVAWGPFHQSETWNNTLAHRRVNDKTEVSGTVGYASQKLSLGNSHENETSWDREYFDKGSSMKLFCSSGKKTAVAHGVRWTMQQNSLQGNGIPQQVRLAVLLSRPSAKPYRVTFRLYAHTGSIIDATKNAAFRLAGKNAGDTLYWRFEPDLGNKEDCYAEGLEIIKYVDTDNLDNMPRDSRDISNLNANWIFSGNRFEVPETNVSPDATSELGNSTIAAGMGNAARLAEPAVTLEAKRDSEERRGEAVCGPQGARMLTGHLPVSDQYMMTLPRGGDDIHMRLVSLEARATQAEGRLAAQEMQALKLQQALARMEQAVAAVSKPLAQ